MRWTATLLTGALVALASASAHAETFDWMFRVDSLSDGFSGPPSFLGQQLGSGTLTTSATSFDTQYDDGFGDVTPAKGFTVTSITGNLAGATITGLGTSANWQSDNTLAFVPDQGWVLGPNGVLVVNTDRKVDGAAQLYLSADNFAFGGFVDTANGNEWQGSLTLTPVPAAAATAPSAAPAPLPPLGATSGGALALALGLGWGWCRSAATRLGRALGLAAFRRAAAENG